MDLQVRCQILQLNQYLITARYWTSSDECTDGVTLKLNTLLITSLLNHNEKKTIKYNRQKNYKINRQKLSL